MTYSVGVTGAPADSLPAQVETLVLPDGATTTTEMQRAMMLGTPLLCRRPDGSTGYYTLDAERSTPTVPVLKAM